MDHQEQLELSGQSRELIDHATTWRTFAANPIAVASKERPWRLTMVFHDRGSELELHFATEGEAQRAQQVLLEVFGGCR